MSRRSESGFRHGLRVRVGARKGVLLHCQGRTGDGYYWKIRLQSGLWVWPDDFAVDGPGTVLGDSCAQCGLPYYHRGEELICMPCGEASFGPASRVDAEPRRKFDKVPAHRRAR
jgi:hypothetical protein